MILDMSTLLHKALARVAALPPDEQDAIASQILASLDGDELWKKRFAGKREAVEGDERGETRPLDDVTRWR